METLQTQPCLGYHREFCRLHSRPSKLSLPFPRQIFTFAMAEKKNRSSLMPPVSLGAHYPNTSSKILTLRPIPYPRCMKPPGSAMIIGPSMPSFGIAPQPLLATTVSSKELSMSFYAQQALESRRRSIVPSGGGIQVNVRRNPIQNAIFFYVSSGAGSCFRSKRNVFHIMWGPSSSGSSQALWPCSSSAIYHTN